MTVYLILMVISVVMAFLNIIIRIFAGSVIVAVIGATLWAFFMIYCMICLMNLKQKFQNSQGSGGVVHSVHT
jgi:hypothetical protein